MSSSYDENTHIPTLEDGYDHQDPQVLGVVGTSAAIIATLLVVGVGVTFYFNSFRDRIIEKTQNEPVAQDLLDLRSTEEKNLSTYAVADKATGAIRLPIGRAMDLIIAEAKEGKPKYPTATYIVKKAEDPAAPAATPGTPAPANTAVPPKPASH